MSKMMRCKGCNAEISKGAKRCPQCGKKNKKPGGLIILAVIIVLILISIVSGKTKNKNEKETEHYSEYSWPTTGVASLLPKPDSKYGRIISESKDYFSMYVYYVSPSDFNEYVNKCKDKGFTVDYNSSSTHYYADDAAGNDLSLYYNDKDEELRISISAPAEESDAKEQDEPDNSDAGTDSENIDGSKGAAESADGDGNKVGSETEESSENSPSEESASEDNDMDFRAWVDSYEDFMNEYVDFMQKYQKSGGTDVSLLLDYAEYMGKYTEFLDATEKVDAEDLSLDDYAYYIAAQTRILKKLEEISSSDF